MAFNVLDKLKKFRLRRRKAPKAKPKPLYQAKRSLGTEQRWAVISANLDEKDQSLIDIGCNLGTLTRYAADKGLFALGVDHLARAIASAQEANHDVPNLAFMRCEITPEMIAQVPNFDVTLCLSVYHYWMSHYGEAAAWSLVAALIKKSKRKFFFEPASLLKKYGEHPPSGVGDLNRDGLIDYHLTCLTRAAGKGWTVLHLGETECLGKESFRLLFMLSRT